MGSLSPMGVQVYSSSLLCPISTEKNSLISISCNFLGSIQLYSEFSSRGSSSPSFSLRGLKRLHSWLWPGLLGFSCRLWAIKHKASKNLSRGCSSYRRILPVPGSVWGWSAPPDLALGLLPPQTVLQPAVEILFNSLGSVGNFFHRCRG